MLADMTSGTIIYKLKETDAKGKFARYHVLAESDINSVVSLGDQKRIKRIFIQINKEMQRPTISVEN